MRVLKKTIASGLVSFAIISLLTSASLYVGKCYGYCDTAVALPLPTSKIVTPSLIQTNCSFKMIGLIIQVKTIVRHDVDEIKMMFPKPIAKPLKV